MNLFNMKANLIFTNFHFNFNWYLCMNAWMMGMTQLSLRKPVQLGAERVGCSADLNYAGWSKNQSPTWQILWENSTIYWTLFEH